jgi:plasmid stability protein
MAPVTARNLPDETHRALRMRAATHGRSTEAEIRAIFVFLLAAAHGSARSGAEPQCVCEAW